MSVADPSQGAAASEPVAGAAAVLDRAISPISGRLGGGRMGKVVSLVALAAGCGVFLFVTGHHPQAKAKGPEDPASQVVPFEPAKAAPAPSLANPGANAPVLDPTVPALTPAKAQPAGAAQDAAAAAATQAQVQAAIRGAPILAYNQGGGALAATLAAAQGASAATAPSVEAAHAASELDQFRQGSTITLARASRLPNRHFLITAGSSVPCTLQTAMDTATPGFVSCLIGQDVYSDDGAVVLMEKGTKVLGEYRSGMRQGQSRLFVLWTRAVTPAGVAIGLASPASDPLGRAGFDGVIDTHFWSRFGGALLLSIIDDGSAAVASRADPNGETLRVPSDAASVALQNSINIPPSLRNAQGSEVSIFVAQDLDFSTVYALKAR